MNAHLSVSGGSPVTATLHPSAIEYFPTIDMRRLSRPPPAPSVISCTIDSALLYIMVARNRNTIWPPPPQHSLRRRAALTTNSNVTQSAHKGKRRGRGGLDTILMYTIPTHIFSLPPLTHRDLIFRVNMSWNCYSRSWRPLVWKFCILLWQAIGWAGI
jgi:hypothetical protein